MKFCTFYVEASDKYPAKSLIFTAVKNSPYMCITRKGGGGGGDMHVHSTQLHSLNCFTYAIMVKSYKVIVYSVLSCINSFVIFNWKSYSLQLVYVQ